VKLEVRDITKKFGDFVANDKISFTAQSGRIHALLGENGAGKTTLMNILYGLLQPDGGQILIDDKEYKFSGPIDSMNAGIGMVHQHFMLIPVFTVAQNLILGNEPTDKFGIIDIKSARQKVQEISDEFGFEVNPDDLVEDLPVGVQQRVEIIKVLSRNAQILILDEPTAVLTPQETDELIEVMKQLRDSGKIIIFITHKLREVKEVADDITIIRRGKVVASAKPTDSEETLASEMVGRKVSLTTEKNPPHLEGPSLVLKDISRVEKNGKIVLNDINLTVEKGEVLGIAGVQGNGQTELSEVLLGLLEPTQGEIIVDNQVWNNFNVKKRLDLGLGFIPEDRNLYGLVNEFSIENNLVLDSFDHAPYGKYGSIQPKVIENEGIKLAEKFDIRYTQISDPISSLSGGNQQKVIVAREMNKDILLFVACQPTRGLDVGSIEFIHSEIIKLRDQGVPVIVISTELDEIFDLSDRIAVMYHGAIIDIVPPTIDRSKIGMLMAGVKN